MTNGIGGLKRDETLAMQREVSVLLIRSSGFDVRTDIPPFPRLPQPVYGGTPGTQLTSLVKQIQRGRKEPGRPPIACHPGPAAGWGGEVRVGVRAVGARATRVLGVDQGRIDKRRGRGSTAAEVLERRARMERGRRNRLGEAREGEEEKGQKGEEEEAWSIGHGPFCDEEGTCGQRNVGGLRGPTKPAVALILLFQ